MKSLFYTSALIAGVVASVLCVLRAQRKSPRNRAAVVGAWLSATAVMAGTGAICFADPLIIRPLVSATDIQFLPIYISSNFVVLMLMAIQMQLVLWFTRGIPLTLGMIAASGLGGIVLGAMSITMCQHQDASKYVGTSLRALIRDIAAPQPLSEHAVHYAVAYYAYAGFVAATVAIGFSLLAIGAKGVNRRTLSTAVSAALAALFGLAYAVMGMVAVIGGAHDRVVLPFGGVETATAFAICGGLVFIAGLLLPQLPYKSSAIKQV
ncbi:hypothetical protein [Streptomyces sp. NPDC091027]|uniref:hypothetical protein n=1 Tax=Streptomyces sp. NPDC091027 TaxID=3365971 RepID=UPI00380976E0